MWTDAHTKSNQLLAGFRLTNLGNINIIQPTLPSKWFFESLESETTNLTQSTEQISSRTFNSQPERMRTPPPIFPNINTSLYTPNKHQMYDEVENYHENALKKSGNDFKKAIMLKIEDNDANSFCLYCEKILIDL
ncbi:16219_t:CDS:2 [Dentiscutata erythropus]|uniref:16219_t:CDS:1 n=1 Tax=Dentiscutata erythropus TaxID=1348616 RepID=A0A9N9CC96_9GLOM|nr:16219_t:CDS:2 [Dentiscutata erythropus]